MSDNLPQEPFLDTYPTSRKNIRRKPIYFLLGLLVFLTLLLLGSNFILNRYGKFWEKEKKTSAQLIGVPQFYRPANPDLNNYYQGLEKSEDKEEAGSPDVKMDSQGNFLSPVYPRETILWELNQINPMSLLDPLKGNAGTFRARRELINKHLVSARQALGQGDKAKAKEALFEAEIVFANTSFDGEAVKAIIPQTEEEKRKFGPAGKSLGVSPVWLQPYFRMIELLNTLEIK